MSEELYQYFDVLTMCDLLVDQDRCIGGNPVGYKCPNTAVIVLEHNGLWYLCCNYCRTLLEENPSRVTFPSFGAASREIAIAIGRTRVKETLSAPAEVFQGAPRDTLSAAFTLREQRRIESLKEVFTDKIVVPFLEKAFPEAFWEVVHTFSPRTKILRRRKEPTLEVRW